MTRKTLDSDTADGRESCDMSAEKPKGIELKDLDEVLSLAGNPVLTLRCKKEVPLTRKLAVVNAVETYSEAEKDDKFVLFDLGLRFYNAGDSVKIDAKESVLIQAAIEVAWPQPGIYVPLCMWLEGGATS